MPTYFIRERPGGEIVNAVECGDIIGAIQVCENMEGDFYPDPHPPTAVLERYYYWSHRP